MQQGLCRNHLLPILRAVLHRVLTLGIEATIREVDVVIGPVSLTSEERWVF